MNGAQLLIQELQRRGVPFVATLCGHGLNPFDAACREAGLRLVDVRNEQNATYMAEAYGRLSRRVGVCAISSGVAHANGMTGLVNAYLDGAPMLLITGSGSTQTTGLGHFQDLDQVAMAAPVCKYARTVDRADRIPQIIHEAFSFALSGRPGPVHLTIPADVQTSEVNPEKVIRIFDSPSGKPLPAMGDPELIQQAAELINKAKRPLLIAGGGVYYAEGEQALATFVKAQSIPVVIPIWDRGSIAHPIGEFMGVLGAASGGPRLLGDSDLMIMVGATCDYRVGYLQTPAIREDARIIRIDRDAKELGRGVGAHLSILGDPRSVMNQLNDACTSRGKQEHEAWLKEAQARREAFRKQCLEVRKRAPKGLHSLDIVQAVQSVLTDDTVLAIDGGNIGQWVHQILCDRYPGHWVTCGASGTIGNGVAGAMAARLLYPDRPIIVTTGDGSLTYGISEFEPATRQRLPFVVIVADDETWGSPHTQHMSQFGVGITTELGPIRFDQVAQGFGADAVRVTQPAEIASFLKEGLSSDRPYLIHVPVVRSNPGDK